MGNSVMESAAQELLGLYPQVAQTSLKCHMQARWSLGNSGRWVSSSEAHDSAAPAPQSGVLRLSPPCRPGSRWLLEDSLTCQLRAALEDSKALTGQGVVRSPQTTTVS